VSICLQGIVSLLLTAHAAVALVSGTVSDTERGAPIAGATVALPDLDRVTTTDPEGRYALPDVPSGPQHVIVRRVGYAPQTFHALVPPQGTLEINIGLRAEPIPLDEVSVDASVPVRGLDVRDDVALPDRGLSIAAVRNHPLLSEPDALQAMAGGEVILRPESPSGVNVRGGGSDQIAYLLDGVPIFSPYHVAGTFAAWNPDAISWLDLTSVSARSEAPDALSGVMSARTRSPGPRSRTQGSLSSTQARTTFDGPLGSSGAGYLLSMRSGFPSFLIGNQDPSHVRGRSADGIGTLSTPLLGGEARLLGYGSVNTISVAAAPESSAISEAMEGTRRSTLTWQSQSYGAEWTRRLGGASLRLQAWSAYSGARGIWRGADSLAGHLSALRRDEGLVAMVETGGEGRASAAGIRAERSRTSYDLRSLAGGIPILELDGRTPVWAAFVQHARPLSARGGFEAGLTAATAIGRLFLSPSAQLTWKPAGGLTVTGAYARRHQFAQSVRNPESVVSTIFPVDLYVGAGSTGMPVARSDLGILAVENRPMPGVRVRAQAFARGFRSLALVAPRNVGPYSATGFVTGNGEACGLSMEVGASGKRYGAVASYGLQHVRLEYRDTSYVPDHGATHSLAGGVIVFPSATSSVRLGVESILGRRATAAASLYEWGACSLLDRGSEFVGSPSQGTLGATRLPAYLRVDLGVRKHWHFKIADREGQIECFGTATNLLGRKNVLTTAIDPSTGRRTQVEMRPRSPLVVGIDWRF
jgi:CarboxypepD_reg-like domain/TonB-dependent Receptor Plug Domain